jgi:hypothetical protein
MKINTIASGRKVKALDTFLFLNNGSVLPS